MKLHAADADKALTFYGKYARVEMDGHGLDKVAAAEPRIRKACADGRTYAAMTGMHIHSLAIIEHLAFDTNLFGIPTYRFSDIVVDHGLSSVQQVRAVQDVVREALHAAPDAKFVQAKIDARDTFVVQALEQLGFFLASTDITLHKELTQVAFPAGVVHATAEDVDELYAMTKGAYTTTRFHMDPNIALEKADDMQAIWIRNCFVQKLADTILLAKEQGRLQGFNAIKVFKNVVQDGKPTGRIILVATKASEQGKGVGSRLLQASDAWFVEQDCGAVVVGTQLSNLALGFYQKAGYKIVYGTQSMHFWKQ